MACTTCRIRFELCALAVLLAACARKPSASPEALYLHSRELLQLEKLDEASASANRGLAIAQAGSEVAWRLHLVRAEILLAEREAAQARAELANIPFEKLQSPELRARYRLCQSHLCLLLHDKKGAPGHLNEAEVLAGTAHAGRLLAEIHLRRASLHIASGDSEAARRDLDQVFNYAHVSHDRFLELGATGSMGFMLMQDDQYDAAVPWFRHAAAQAKALGVMISEARAVGNLGICLFELGDFAKALPSLQWAEARIAATKDRYERQIWLGNIGNIEEQNGEYENAAADYAKALAIARQLGDEYWIALWLDNLASLSIERKDWDAAERFNNEASAHKGRAGDEKSAAYSVVNSGQIANGRARYDEAISLFKKVMASPSQDVILMVESHAGLAESYGAGHRDSAAVLEFQTAVRQMELRQSALPDEEHKLSWFASVIRTYQQYVDFLMQRGRSLDALAVVLSSRGRVLNSRMGNAGSQAQMNASYLQRIVSRSDAALLVYFVGSRQSYAWVIDKQGIRSFQLPPEAELRRLVSSYDDFVQHLHDPLSEPCSAGKALYESLVLPAGISEKKVMVAPDGPLYSLNFGALPVSGDAPPHYWLEDAEISVVPSFDIVRAATSNTEPSLLLIGDPVQSDPDYSELAYASQEMNGIQQHLRSLRRIIYARENARPAAYFEAKPQQFSWIHFVAHAASNQEEPLLSAVVLSRSPGAEYRLFAKDVLKNPINAELVTISGCRGAGAKVYQGEGLVGFSWAFLKSGARNVIAGLWDVNDRSTAELMTALYAELANGARPAQALHAAQLAMAKSAGVYRKPYYWAPFEVFKCISVS